MGIISLKYIRETSDDTTRLVETSLAKKQENISFF